MVLFAIAIGMMIAENWITDIAIILDKDPSVIREKNLFREGNMTHYTQVVENDALERCWKECLAQSKYLEVKEELKKFNEENKWKKKGIAIIPTMFGISFTAPYLNQAGKNITNRVEKKPRWLDKRLIFSQFSHGSVDLSWTKSS